MMVLSLTNLILPLVSIITIAIIAILFFKRGKNEVTDYEKKMKKLRQSLLKGELDRKTFLHIRDILTVEDTFVDETQRLEDMLAQKSIDSETCKRMKKILKMNLNERLKKISLTYNCNNKI